MSKTKTRKRSGRAATDPATVTADIIARLDVMAEYRALGVNFTSDAPRASGNAECYSFARPDERRPSAYVDTTTGRYGDSAGGEPEISLWEFASRASPSLYPTWQAARAHYAAKAGVDLGGLAAGKRGRGRPKATAEDWRVALGFEEWSAGNLSLARYWCARHKPGVTVEALLAAGGKVARYPCGRKAKASGELIAPAYKVICVPIFGPGLLDSEPVGYVAWNINGHPIEVFAGKGKPPLLVKMKTVGSASGLIGRHGLEILAAAVDPAKAGTACGKDEGAASDVAPGAAPAIDHIYKVEGPTDLLALWAALPPDLRSRQPILTQAGGAKQVPVGCLSPFAGHRILITGDNDIPGQAGAEKWAAALHGGGAVATIAREVCCLHLPGEVTANHGLDLRGWLTAGTDAGDGATGGSYEALAELALWAEPWTPLAPEALPASARPAGEQSSAAGSSTSGPTPPAPVEADDDPHRLARINLDRFARHKEGATLRYWRSEFYTWSLSRGAYRKIDRDELRAKCGAAIKEEFDRQNLEAADFSISRGEPPPDTRKVTKPLVTNVLDATATMTIISSSVELNTWIEGDGQRVEDLAAAQPGEPGAHGHAASNNYVAMANGVLDLERLLADNDADTISDVLLPHSPAWFSTIRLPYAFDMDARCPRWDSILEQNLDKDPERIKLLQEWAGYLILPDTGHQKFLMLEGEGGNGKSVFLAAIEAMLGSANCSHIPLEQFGDRFAKTQTLGKLANICADTGELDRVAEGYLKSFTSGDTMFFDRKGIPGVDCVPTARLMLSCNNRPRLSDRSSGIWRRMLIVPFNVEVPANKRVINMDKPWWWEKSGELPGIFMWALAGLHRLRKQGRFTDSEHCKAAIDDYKIESNPARGFLVEHIEESEDSGVRTEHLYQLYRRWAEANGYHAMGERTFGKEVSRVFPSITKARGGGRDARYYFYRNIRLRVEHDVPENSDKLLFN